MNESLIKIKSGNVSYYIDKTYVSYRDFVCTVPRRFAEGDGEVLHAGRNELRLFNVGRRKFVAKRYKRVGMLQRVVYSLFRRTKAHRAFDYARVFRARGIDTPHEVAYIEQREHGWFTTGYFICEDSPYPSAFHALEEAPEPDRSLIDALVAFVLTMHKRGILHGDLNFGNFLCERLADGRVNFAMVDINRSHFCKGMPSKNECIDNLTTVTHRRDLYDYIVRRYAHLRGWNEDEASARAFRNLDRMEERNRKKNIFKNRLKK